MNYLKTYLKTITDRGNIDLARSIEQTAAEVGDKYIQDFNFCEHRIGLLFGNVQSGKTGQMFGIITKATDMGFPAFVLLTTDNVVLQQQTLERVQNDLSGYCICGENDSGLFIQNSLMKPAINATNNALIAQVESGTEHIKIYYPSGLKPTRSNVLDERHVAAISGGTNYYPFYPSNDTIEQLDKLLAPFTEDEPVYQVSLRIMKEILSHIESDDDSERVGRMCR